MITHHSRCINRVLLPSLIGQNGVVTAEYRGLSEEFLMGRRPARFTQADLSRAIRAIDQAGADMIVEILPDGTMRIAQAHKSAGDSKAGDHERTVFR